MATKALSFDIGDYVVYPKHGVGRVVELQSTEIAGTRLELYVLRFEKEKMTLRVPVNKADSVGMRKLSSDKTMKDALDTLNGKPRVKRTMWSRRAQEYEAKINSGDLSSIAEVVRDLFRPDDAPEQSYSERQIFEAASSRLARELGAMEQTDEKAALAASTALVGCGDHGGGGTVARNYQVGNFQQIEVAGPYDVDVRTGSGPTVSASGPEKLLGRTVVAVQGDKLVIHTENSHGFH